MTMTPNDPRLTAYALGELDDSERTEVEVALTQSPALAAEVDSIRAAAATLEAAFHAEPVLALSDEQRSTIDPSRVRQGDVGTKGRWDEEFMLSERGAEATRSPRPSFLRRYWIPTTVAASVTLAVAVGYLMLPELSSDRVPSKRLVHLRSADLNMPPDGTDASGSGGSSAPKDETAYSMSPSSRSTTAPNFGEGVPQIDLAKLHHRSSATTSDTTGKAKSSSGTPQSVPAEDWEPLASAADARSVGNQELWMQFVVPPVRLEYDPLGGLPATISDFGTAATTLGRTASPNENLELHYDFQNVRNISFGYQVPFGPRDTQPREGVDNRQILAADRGPYLSMPGERFVDVLSTDFETEGAPSASDPYRCVRLAWEPAPDGGELTRCIKFELTEAPSGDAYAPVFDNPFHLVAHQPLSTFSIDVDTASYSNVRRMLNAGSLPPRDAVRIEEIINYFDYDYPLPTDGRPFSVSVETSDCPWSPTHRLARIGIKGMEFAANQRPAANLVFLIDVSGSMQPANRLPLVQQSLRMLVGELRRDDQVAMVVYAGASGLVLPATRCGNPGTILEAIDRLQAGGSTNGGAGIQLAYETAEANFIEGGVNRVILATDGDFNVGVTNGGELTTLVAKRSSMCWYNG
jgi:Ca-activated chloride channel family protein